MKKSHLLICFLFSFIFIPNVFASNLAYDRQIHDSLPPAKMAMYDVVTRGYKDVRLGSTKEEVINQVGEEPIFQTRVGRDEFIIYTQHQSFDYISLHFSHNQLKCIMFLKPSKELTRLTRSDIIEVLGDPQKKTTAKMVFINDDATKKVSFVRSTYTYPWKKLYYISIDNRSTCESLKHAYAMMKGFSKIIAPEIEEKTQAFIERSTIPMISSVFQ